MKVTCHLTIECTTHEDAKKVLQSVEVDDAQFVTSTVKGTTLEADIKSTSVASLLHTLDDYLACVSVATSLVNKN